MDPKRFTLTLIAILLLLTITKATNDYNLQSFEYSDELKSRLSAKLKYSKDSFNPQDFPNINLQNPQSIALIKDLTVSIELECDKILHIKITDTLKERWEPPLTLSEEYKEKIKQCTNSKSLEDFGFSFETDTSKPFTYSLTKDGSKYYTSEGANLLYSNTLLVFDNYLTSNDIYGFGERYHKFKLNDGIYTSWPNDTAGIHEDMEMGGDNLMGIQPLGLHRTNKGKFLGLVFNNINAQDTVIKTIDSQSKVSLEHRTIGGIIDYYIYIGDTPDDVLVNMHDIIGQPMLPPYWSLGFHQCRWGYRNTEDMRDVVNKYRDNNLPIDTFWGDIDILEDKRIFTLNSTDFLGLPQLISDLHANHMNFIPIVDLGFPKNDIDIYYKKGLELDAFIMSNYTKKPMVSFVWPGNAVFPDLFTDNGVKLWDYAMEEYYKDVKYDGIWIDMNEPAMIVALENCRGELEVDTFDPQFNEYEFIPYVPGYRANERTDIRTHTMSENAYSQTGNPFHYTYNMKALLSYRQAEVTNNYLRKQNRRPFVLSRSTVLGIGKVSFHWLGDNNSNFNDMRNGVNGIFSFNVFGIPMVGDDICGFGNDSSDSLCARWYALGSFFPFARNHNSIGWKAQDPATIGPITLNLSKISLRYRYSLIRYFYTQMFLISVGKTGSFFKPTFFEFPNEKAVYENIDEHIMVGPGLYLLPFFDFKEAEREIYFPNANWNEYGSWNNVADEKEGNEGTQVKIAPIIEKVFLYLRGGYIVPRQETFGPIIRHTYDLHNAPTELIITPNKAAMAEGDIIIDNDDKDTLNNGDYLHVHMSYIYDQIFFSQENNFKTSYDKKDVSLSKIRILRADDLIKNGIAYAQVKDIKGRSWAFRLIKEGESRLMLDVGKTYIRLDEVRMISLFTYQPNLQ